MSDLHAVVVARLGDASLEGGQPRHIVARVLHAGKQQCLWPWRCVSRAVAAELCGQQGEGRSVEVPVSSGVELDVLGGAVVEGGTKAADGAFDGGVEGVVGDLGGEGI
jgi:hypothetical protein